MPWFYQTYPLSWIIHCNSNHSLWHHRVGCDSVFCTRYPSERLVLRWNKIRIIWRNHIHHTTGFWKYLSLSNLSIRVINQLVSGLIKWVLIVEFVQLKYHQVASFMSYVLLLSTFLFHLVYYLMPPLLLKDIVSTL